MKNLRLARIQFLAGIISLALTGVVVFTWFVPQFSQFQKARRVQTVSDPALMAIFNLLPALTAESNASWQKDVLDVLSADSLETHTVITQIKGGPKALEPVDPLPDTLKKVPLTIIAYGSYNALQQFIDRIGSRFPYAAIRSVSMRNVESSKLAPEESPVLECTLQVDMYARHHAL